MNEEEMGSYGKREKRKGKVMLEDTNNEWKICQHYLSYIL